MHWLYEKNPNENTNYPENIMPVMGFVFATEQIFQEQDFLFFWFVAERCKKKWDNTINLNNQNKVIKQYKQFFYAFKSCNRIFISKTSLFYLFNNANMGFII